MDFIIFFIYFVFSLLILIAILFILWKLFLKKLIYTKFSEFAILNAFNDLDHKSILDINLPNESEEVENNDKTMPTIF